MSQMTKTIVFAGLAIASAALAFATRTGPVGVAAPDEVGKPLFSAFKDPLEAKSMKIVRFDEGLASLSEIEIKDVDGIWTLPSHQGYPADAENKIRDAATPFVDMDVISVVSDATGEHSLYGVVEPSVDKSAVGDEGVGTLVNIKDEKGNDLVNVVIGKEFQEGQHFVRPANVSRVYIVATDPSKLPVRFEEWIEKDLLKISSFDVQSLTLKDYSFEVAQTLRGVMTDYDQRLEIAVTDDNGTWNLDRLLEARDRQLQPTELLDGEELNKERLDDLKDALDELEIVDVERKPDGLGADLKADKGFISEKQADIESLAERGFYAVEMPDGGAELLSTDGEVLVNTKDGVQYVLRFGRVAGVDTESGVSGLNRYLLVSARVNEDHFPQPELETIPELPPALSAASDPTDGSTEADATEADATEADATAAEDTDAEDTDAEDTDAEVSDETEPAPETDDGDGDAAAANADEASDADSTDAASSEGEPAEVEDEAEATKDPPADSTGDDGAVEDDGKQTKEEIQAERERITQENQRKIDERNANLKKAQDKVREANYRFADWYYVISEEVYKKIHLGRADIIKETEDAKDTGFDVDSFRQLENNELERDDAADTDQP